MRIISFKSGKKVYDWKIPHEWHIEDAYVINKKNKKKIIDFKKNNLSVLNYSQPVNKILNYSDLIKNIYFLKKQPSAIPYITSYYSKNWGFCTSYNDFKKLDKKAKYHVVIKSKFLKGKMSYGEILLKGRSDKEILISTNICHPSMGNNETSGIVVTAELASWISRLNNRRYSYRIIFIPETIGSIAYIHKNFKKLKKNVKGGFVVVCVGRKGKISYLPSKTGNTLSDKAALHVLTKSNKKFKKFSFFDRGSDERQFCSNKINLPICSIMSAKYGDYKEYHTSLDNINFISGAGLYQSYSLIKNSIEIIEKNYTYKNIYPHPGEPKLSNYNLRHNISFKINYDYDKLLLNILLLSDGSRDLLSISKILKADFDKIHQISKKLETAKLLKPL